MGFIPKNLLGFTAQSCGMKTIPDKNSLNFFFPGGIQTLPEAPLEVSVGLNRQILGIFSKNSAGKIPLESHYSPDGDQILLLENSHFFGVGKWRNWSFLFPKELQKWDFFSKEIGNWGDTIF